MAWPGWRGRTGASCAGGPMPERPAARDLLGRAKVVYDHPAGPLAALARGAGLGGFQSGGCWMQQALAHLRGTATAGPVSGLNALGALKYGLAGAAAVPVVVVAVLLERWPLLLLCVPAFY